MTREYSPTDNGVRTYSYTVESRLRAVYEGNTLQMAAAYDGDGNRVYQLSYNPEKDEDFSAYYSSHKNADYDGTGIQLKAWGEVSATEEDLMGLMGASGAVLTSRYELIEYVNDVNREHAEVLVEQNLNGRVDTVYTYGTDRIGREMFGQVSRTSYYLYDPRGSVAGLTDGKGHLTGTYQYGVSGELTYGGARYENEYTYNGESYSPVIRSQYLRARYYCVTTASFLTEDAYLGSIREPLTLNRYNYCLSSYLNYRDPSGKFSVKEAWEKTEAFVSGVFGSMTKGALLKLSEIGYPFVAWENLMERLGGPSHGFYKGLMDDYLDMAENYVLSLSGEASERTEYYAGRCTGDVLFGMMGAAEIVYGGARIYGGFQGIGIGIAGGGNAIVISAGVAEVVKGIAIAADGTLTVTQGLHMLEGDMDRLEESKKKRNNSADDALDWEEYYIEGRPEGGNPKEDTLVRKDVSKIKSEEFMEFLESKGETPSKWKKVMETWETQSGDVYERHYWTNGVKSYYHE